MLRVRGHRICNVAIATERLWQVAVLTAAGAIGFASHAKAALFYWGDSEPGFYRSAPTFQPRRQGPRRQSAKPAEKDTSAKPVGPLIIAISIEKQKVRVYDANGFFAESPVSTGMKGHPTPLGVFSIIQKHRLHHSNIYSGAPMPFCSGSPGGRRHASGVLPGYRHRMAASACRRCCPEDVELDQDGCAGDHHPRRDDARQFFASAAGDRRWRRRPPKALSGCAARREVPQGRRCQAASRRSIRRGETQVRSTVGHGVDPDRRRQQRDADECDDVDARPPARPPRPRLRKWPARKPGRKPRSPTKQDRRRQNPKPKRNRQRPRIPRRPRTSQPTPDRLTP